MSRLGVACTGMLLLFALGVSCGGDPSANPADKKVMVLGTGKTQRPNVIIYLIDALRADHLGCYGYPKGISPNIDAFADEAVVFERAIAQASYTRPSVASLFTGLHPQAHQTNRRDEALPAEATTLAELLHPAGYHTAAFVTNGNVAKPFGFQQGFVDFVELLESDWKTAPRLSNEVNTVVFNWLKGEEQHSHPFFLYVHTMDPHAPYQPPDVYRKRFAAQVNNKELGTISSMIRLARGESFSDFSVVEDLISLYDAEIAFNDHSFGMFLDELKGKGLYENSLIILLADHGEEFYEHGGWQHARTLNAEVLNIPLIIKFPSTFGKNSPPVSEPVQHIDILPTVLDGVNIPTPNHVQGRSLVSLLSANSSEQFPPIFSYLDGRQAVSVTSGSWKLIRYRKPSVSTHLYNLENDPAEQHDLFEANRVRAGYLLSLIKEHERNITFVLTPAKAVIDEKIREQLKALGYAQ